MKAKIFLIKLLMFFICFSVYSQTYKILFNSKITDSELELLSKGETLIRNIGDKKNISLTKSNSEYVKNIHNELNKKNPNYLAEIIKIIPKTTKTNNIKQLLYEGIFDIESYTNIPYYSERNKRWYDLYSYAKIDKIVKKDSETIIDFTTSMEPFGTIKMKGSLEETNDSLFYSMINTSKIIYERMNLTCVKTENMYNAITLFEYDNYYILYGIGAVNAPSVFFMKDRIEKSLVGRIKCFFKYMFEQIKIK